MTLYECVLPDGSRVERRVEARVSHVLAVLGSQRAATWFAWRWTDDPLRELQFARAYFRVDVRIVTLPATAVPSRRPPKA